MSEKPRISAELLAALTEAVPARIQKKFEAEPTAAQAWVWAQVQTTWTIAAGNETVTLHHQSLTIADHVTCSCLLGPRCLHVLSVIHTLAIGVGEDSPPADSDSETTNAPEAPSVAVDAPEELTLTQAQNNAARSAFEAGAKLLERGLSHATLTNLTEVLRALHQCRVHGLYRLSAAGQRVAESMRLFREKSPAFDRELFTDELTEMLTISHHLLHLPLRKDWVGTARREYVDVGGKKLAGVFCEPVVTRTGYGGVVAYFIDDSGDYWTLSDVMPGNTSRANGAYVGGVSIGDVSMAPKELCRSGILLQSATASEEGRLGSGKKVKAVTFKPRDWNDLKVWDVPLAQQYDRALDSRANSGTLRAGADLLYLELEVIGAWQESLIAKEKSGAIFKAPPIQFNPGLKYAENTKMLARAPGLHFRAIARPVEGKIDTIEIIAIGTSPQVDDATITLKLPDEFKGRINFGFDALRVEHVAARRSSPHAVDFQVRDLDEYIHVIRKRVVAAAYGGRLSTEASSKALQRDSALLQTRMMTNAADLLQHVLAQSAQASRTFTGELTPFEPAKLARVWCMASNFVFEMRRELVRASF